MKNFKRFSLIGILLWGCEAAASADYTKGTTMFQIYGGGAALDGHYHQPGVDRDEQDYADSGGLIGGQFLYFFHESPCLAVGFDVSHANYGKHTTSQMLANRLTAS